MLHVKFENCMSSAFREEVVLSCSNKLFLDKGILGMVKSLL